MKNRWVVEFWYDSIILGVFDEGGERTFPTRERARRFARRNRKFYEHVTYGGPLKRVNIYKIPYMKKGAG